MQTLMRHADSLFWMGRHIERTASLAGILLVQTAFERGRSDRANWNWILTLYDESAAFAKKYDSPTAANVIRYYVNDLSHPGSIISSIKAIRSNARALRALISSDLWVHINRVHSRITSLSEFDISEQRLAATCEQVQLDCYGLLGICNATFYRDAGWRFLELGLEIERADQMSRLLDVRYAQILSLPRHKQPTSGDFIHWSMLLRACAGHHAFRRLVAGPLEAENVAHFLIFEKRFVRSLAHCELKITKAIEELRVFCDLSTPEPLLKSASEFYSILRKKRSTQKLVPQLHQFNDAIQCSLANITDQLTKCYFNTDVQVDDIFLWQTQSQSRVGQSANTRLRDGTHAVHFSGSGSMTQRQS